ncbi:Clp protease N-terminal domain-containing protein [Streptosporangiaceae bacterium NEAU-GS5]|nr:Clp protease N-terminal domain-containing protein [Streptosporangiaceae bacterium NEAU-GS5]
MSPTTSPFAVVVKAALDESRLRGSKRLGTEHLLLGLLRDPVCAAALGTGVEEARAALDQLDREALAAIGIDVTGMSAAAPPRKRVPFSQGRLTSGARTAIDAGIRGTTIRTRAKAPQALLLELLACEPPDPCAVLLDRLAVDRAAARAHLTPRA